MNGGCRAERETFNSAPPAAEAWSHHKDFCKLPGNNDQLNGISDLIVEGDIKVKIGRSVTYQWVKSADGIVRVPIVISPLYTSSEQASINGAVEEFNTMTCVQFVNRSSETDYLYILPQTKCWSYIGKIGGRQELGLSQTGCMGYARIQHELMHSLGFHHEQNRGDRDEYIEILWDNISPDSTSYYDIDVANTLGLQYDYMSNMHFDMYDYSISPSLPTYYIKSDPSLIISRKIGMDNMDVLRINTLYGCTDLCRTKFVNPSGNFSYDSSSSAQSSSSCLWLIQSTDLVILKLSGINISSPGGYLRVHDGINASSPVLWEKTSGMLQIPPPLVSSGEFMLVEVFNDQSAIKFNAEYKTIKYGGVFTSGPGIVRSPLYPSIPPSDASAEWTIIAPEGLNVTLQFTFFWIRNNCTSDYLLVRDGSINTFPALRKFCSYISPETTITSHGNVMILQYQKSNVADGHGFQLSYYFGVKDKSK